MKNAKTYSRIASAISRSEALRCAGVALLCVSVLRCAVVALLHDYYYCKCLVASDSRDRIPDLETVLKAVAIRMDTNELIIIDS